MIYSPRLVVLNLIDMHGVISESVKRIGDVPAYPVHRVSGTTADGPDSPISTPTRMLDSIKTPLTPYTPITPVTAKPAMNTPLRLEDQFIFYTPDSPASSGSSSRLYTQGKFRYSIWQCLSTLILLFLKAKSQ